MSALLDQIYERLLDQVDLGWKRYLYPTFTMERLTGLVGPRGVGKTTLMLQYIKENLYEDGKAFYFSADNLYFSQKSLLEYVNDLYLKRGIRHFFVDEIHKYENWNQELKNIYDSFPDATLVFSGSSMLDIVSGSYDLSRRAYLYHLKGLSFREYLNIKTHSDYQPIDFKQLIDNPRKFSKLGQIDTVMGHFGDYLERGYYPFSFESEATYQQRILRMIDKVIFEDIANFHNLKTPNLPIFKKILSFLASIEPGEVNTHNIAKNVSTSSQTIEHYLLILESVGLIQMIFPYEGGNQLLRKPQKIFLHNTNLLYALESTKGESVKRGTRRELTFIQALRDAGITVYYSKQGGFRTDNIVFEVGGKNKTRKQLKGSQLLSYLVKDDTIVPDAGVLPLLFLGFLY